MYIGLELLLQLRWRCFSDNKRQINPKQCTDSAQPCMSGEYTQHVCHCMLSVAFDWII